MKLASEALAFIGAPPREIVGAKRVFGYAGSRCEQANQHTKPKENDMPRGKAPKARTTEPGATTPTEETPRKRKYTRRAAAQPAGSPRFGVFDDGSLVLSTAGCKGTLTPSEVRDLAKFINGLQPAK